MAEYGAGGPAEVLKCSAPQYLNLKLKKSNSERVDGIEWKDKSESILKR